MRTSASSLNTAYSARIPSRLAPNRSVRYSGLIGSADHPGWKQLAIQVTEFDPRYSVAITVTLAGVQA